MKVLVASSENYAGCIVDALERHGHQVVGVVSPMKGIYACRSYGPRFWPYALRGWHILPLCRKRGIEFRVVAGLKDGALAAFIRRSRPDLLIVFGWPALVTPETLAQFPLGGMNIHPSMLPKLRGPDPLFHILDTGRTGFGVTFHKLTEALDGGPLFHQARLVSGDGASYDQLYCRLLDGIYTQLPKAMNQLALNPAGTPQQGEASFVRRFRPSYRILDPSRPADAAWRRTRACFAHHSRITAARDTLITFTRFSTMPYRDLIYKQPGTVQRVGLFSLEVNICGRYACLTGVRVAGKPWWTSPFHLARAFTPGESLATAAQARKLAKEAGLL